MVKKIRKTVKIGNKKIGNGYPCFIIAEAGINHNGKVVLAKKLIDIATSAGADAIKFQKRNIDSMLTRKEQARPYIGPRSFGNTYGEHRRALELGKCEFSELKKYCDKKGIIFLASGWDGCLQHQN